MKRTRLLWRARARSSASCRSHSSLPKSSPVRPASSSISPTPSRVSAGFAKASTTTCPSRPSTWSAPSKRRSKRARSSRPKQLRNANREWGAANSSSTFATRNSPLTIRRFSMATFHFDLVSPEKLAFSGEVDQVDVPGAEGDFGVLAGHAPVVAQIRPGILTVTTGATNQKIIVLGGLAEVSDKGLTVLADVATSLEELDRAKFADQISNMEAKLAEKEGSELDRAIERLDHFKSIQHQLNTTALH